MRTRSCCNLSCIRHVCSPHIALRKLSVYTSHLFLIDFILVRSRYLVSSQKELNMATTVVLNAQDNSITVKIGLTVHDVYGRGYSWPNANDQPTQPIIWGSTLEMIQCWLVILLFLMMIFSHSHELRLHWKIKKSVERFTTSLLPWLLSLS